MTGADAVRRPGVYLYSATAMGTVVTIQIVETTPETDRQEIATRALEWFRRVEGCCSRFDPESEVSRLRAHVGTAVPVSDMLFEAVRFALAVAEESGGAFDPTIGDAMAAKGFNRHYQTGELVAAGPAPDAGGYKSVELDPVARAITLHHPVTLDLGGVAKGLAVDMAARELAPLGHFAIDAGGDLFFAGCNADGEPWRAGIRHPREPASLIATLRMSDAALCTSGDYERRVDGSGDHHLLDARTGRTAVGAASVSVLAPTAMAADAFATAAFVLGMDEGLAWLERQRVDGVMVSTSLDRRITSGLADRISWT